MFYHPGMVLEDHPTLYRPAWQERWVKVRFKSAASQVAADDIHARNVKVAGETRRKLSYQYVMVFWIKSFPRAVPLQCRPYCSLSERLTSHKLLRCGFFEGALTRTRKYPFVFNMQRHLKERIQLFANLPHLLMCLPAPIAYRCNSRNKNDENRTR
jgi:hypothetical protein